jgi:photosystem II stability/assembly factor-like uncharacterized protein
MKPTFSRSSRISSSICAALMLLGSFILIKQYSAVRAQESSPIDNSIYQRLQFRSIGPAIMGGRIDDFAVVESNPHIIYAATASGGIWKTVNNGTTWDPLFDDQEVSSIGDVTVAPSNPDIVWAGTGEPNNRQSSSWGNGVYKSTDGGKTWTNTGLKDTHHIARIAIHPQNPDIVYVAAVGHLWGANKERGLYKTTDGGKTWVNSQFINEDTGFIDLAMDLGDPNTLYAAAYQRRRTPFGFQGGGPHGGLYKTSDGGATWTKLTNGLPSDVAGRIGIDIYRKDPRIVYITFEHPKEGGVYRSEDKGETWKKMSSTNPRPMYYSKIRIDPNNDQRIYVLGAAWYTSDNGGRFFAENRNMRIHGDFHAFWINPANSDHLVTGSDGGITLSYDKGKSWDYVNTIPLAQFYEIGFDYRKPYWIYGGLQDNGSWGAPMMTLTQQGVSNDEWIRVGGGDGFYNVVDPKDPNIIYTESQNGNIQRLNLATGESKSIRPRPEEGSRERYRFDWNSPIVISPHNNRKIYLGGNHLFISTNRGDIWETITPDLTKNIDRSKLKIMGVVPQPNILSGQDGQDNYSQITTIAESPIREGAIWVGTDDGNVQVSRDGGKTWRNVIDRIPGVPANTYVTRVIASNAKEGRAYVTFDGHRNDDFKPYAYTTEDFGQTWRAITSDLPYPANVIREHPHNPNLLFTGTEFGLFVSFNRGEAWMRLKNNLPTVPVDDIAIHPRDNDLILGTHGRGIYVLDDTTPLQQMSGAIVAAGAHLFDIRIATMWRTRTHKGSTGHKYFIANNPPAGATINYYLRAKANERPKITILDKSRNVVSELLVPNERGIHRVSWDLRYQSPVPAPQLGEGQRRGGRGRAMRGPRVLPGEYLVRLSVDGKEMVKSLIVEEDPRIEITAADAQARLKIMLAINRLQKSGFDAQRTLDNLRVQINSVEESLKKQANVPQAVSSAVNSLLQEVRGARAGLAPQSGGANEQESAGPRDPALANAVMMRIGRLFDEIDSHTEPAIPRHQEELKRYTLQLNERIERVNKIITESVPNLNKLIAESGMSPIKAGETIAPLQ